MPMRPVMRHIMVNPPSTVLVQWDLDDPDPTRVNGMTFTLQRSGSPRGEWATLATGLSTVFYTDTFEDNADDTEEYNVFSLDREIWYRVLAVFTDGAELASDPMDTDGVTVPSVSVLDGMGAVVVDTGSYPLPDTLFHPTPGLQRRLQLVQRSVQRRAIIALQEFVGVELAVLKKRHFGTRCTACYEPITKQITFSNCSVCYATGWEGGYYPPIVTLGKISEGPLHVQIETEGEVELERAKIDTINFPRLTRHDILVELDSNRRWEIEMVEEPYLRRRRVLQFTTCTEIARTAAAYKVPVERPTSSEIFNASTIP